MAINKFLVEASHIMMFARSVGDANPIYHDEEYAKKNNLILETLQASLDRLEWPYLRDVSLAYLEQLCKPKPKLNPARSGVGPGQTRLDPECVRLGLDGPKYVSVLNMSGSQEMCD